jgi:benzoylformate decarboxylase
MATNGKTTTVWQAFYDILRAYDLKTIFGNPGSTEQPMLKNFPSDFQYVLGLQEASVVGMADGYAQATRKPAVVSLHTAAGTGNAMGTIMTAFCNKTPLILIAGQQHRDMLIGEPLLTNREGTSMPKPWVKWAYEPAQAKDVPAAVIRAIATAVLPPAGPVYLSVPLDDWDKEMASVPVPRLVSTRTAPDPAQVSRFVSTIHGAKRLALAYGQEIDKSLGWDAAVQLAELTGAPVYQAPGVERAVFPETHPLFRGPLPMARGPLCEAVADFDVLLVVGAEVWRYYPFVDGPVSPPGLTILHVTNDPHDASAALVGETLLSDSRLALESLVSGLEAAGLKSSRSKDEYFAASNHKVAQPSGKSPMTALDAFTAIASLRPNDALLVQETPSNGGDLLRAWPAYEPERYFTFASGGLGANGPLSVGVALAQKHHQTGRPTILAIGDGSINYSVQSIYTAVQEKVHLIILVPKNEEYAILKEFAVLEETPHVPALDLPGLDAVAVAKAYGCPGVLVTNAEELQAEFKAALGRDGPSLIEFPIDRELRPLVAQSSAHPK